jgi:dihydroflavonol-4-reductase
MSGSLVCVTGSNGHVGSHVVNELLNHGYRVRATVRSLKQRQRYEFLLNDRSSSSSTSTSIAEQQSHQQPPPQPPLEFTEADLLNTTSSEFERSLSDCRYLIHTASPYFLSSADPQRDLVDPAIRGTLMILEAAANVRSIEKVIITGSIAAVTDAPRNDHVYSERDWNDSSSLNRNPYYYSKIQSERAAWQWMASHKPHFRLISLNPSLCIGPELNPHSSINTSNKILLNCMNGSYPVQLRVSWPFVDVRDVAMVHRLALQSSTMDGRYLVVNETLWFKAG